MFLYFIFYFYKEFNIYLNVFLINFFYIKKVDVDWGWDMFLSEFYKWWGIFYFFRCLNWIFICICFINEYSIFFIGSYYKYLIVSN